MTWLSTNIFPIVLGIMPSTSWQSLSVVSVTFQRVIWTIFHVAKITNGISCRLQGGPEVFF